METIKIFNYIGPYFMNTIYNWAKNQALNFMRSQLNFQISKNLQDIFELFVYEFEFLAKDPSMSFYPDFISILS